MTNLTDAIPDLLSKTVAGKVDWEDLSKGSFIARLGDLSLEIRRSSNYEFELSLLSEEGRVLETVKWGELTSPLDNQLTEIYELARRQALRVDEKLSELQKRLSEL